MPPTTSASEHMKYEPPATTPSPAGARTTAIGVVNLMLRHLRLLVGIPLALAVSVVAIALITGHTWVATSRFTPEGGNASDLSRMAGLAAQFGISVPRSEQASPEFYAQLVRSDDLMRDAVLTPYKLRDGTRTLLDIYFPGDGASDARTIKAIDKLKDHVAVTIDTKSNILTLQVRASDPELATQVNQRILDLVAAFNMKKRQSKAGAERQFVEGRLAEAKSELQQAQSAMLSFLESNRAYRNSPELTAQYDRLSREADLRQQLYSSLAQAYDAARMEEVRNTPVFTVVDRPQGLVRRADHLSFDLLLAVVPGFGFALALAFALEYMQRERADNPDEFVAIDRLLRRRREQA